MKRVKALMFIVTASLLAFQVVAVAETPQPERVAFTTKDGVRIVGDFYDVGLQNDAKPPFVILLHMHESDRTAWAPLIGALASRGISALAIDMRGYGESTEMAGAPEEAPGEHEQAEEEAEEQGEEEEEEAAGAAHDAGAGSLAERVKARDKSVFKDMREDVWSAYVWLAQSGKVDLSRFGLVGASVGSTVAMSYAAKDRSVDVTVCLSPGTKYMGIRTSPYVKKLTDRKLMLISSPEERKACEDLKKYDENADLDVKLGVNGERDLHGTDMFGKVADIETEIADYLSTNLGSPSGEKDMVVASVNQSVYYHRDSFYVERMKERNRRWFSSEEEAKSRGLRDAQERSRTIDVGGDFEP